MKFNLPKFERLHILIITLLVLLVPFSLYYWGFVRLQTAYFTEHKSRQLAVMSNQISAKIKNLGSVVENAGAQLFERAAAEAKKKGRVPKESPLDEFKKTLALGDRLEPLNPFLPIPPKSADAELAKSLTLRWERETEMSKLKIEFTGGWKDGSPAQRLQVEADLGGVLQSILVKEAFDSVLIADAESGDVIHQHNRQSGSKLRVATLDALRDEQKNKLDRLALAQATNIQDVKLAGDDYKLFSRPVEMSIAVSGSDRPGLRWIVCGLINEGHFRRERWAISYTVLIVFTAGMILAALSWSFLKLWLMGAKDRLRVADVYFLLFSAMIGAALLTLFSLYVYTYSSLSHEADEKLSAFAKDVHDNLHAEVRAALDELDRLNEDLLADTESRNLLNAKPQDTRASSSPQAEKRRRIGESTKAALQPKTLEKTHILKQEHEGENEHPYPFFTTAFWIDDDRQQRIKWTTRDATTRFVAVPPTRAYFNNIKQERFLHLDRGAVSDNAKRKADRAVRKDGETVQERTCKDYNDRAEHHDFWLEPITSSLTGVETVIISKKFCPPYSSWVAALDTRLLSMIDTVTPPGYGFSVIEAGGRVLFHSELAQHFEENFYDECDERAELRAAVEARQSTALGADYLGSGHSLYTLPVKDFPGWTIITYRDKQILRTAQLELLVVAANLFLLYSLLLLALFVLIYLWNLNTGERVEWLWARDEAIAFYRGVLFANVCFCLLFGAAIIYFERARLFWLAVAFPFFGLVVAAICLKLSGVLRKCGAGRSDNSHPVIRCRAWYVLMITTLMFLTSVMPAIAFFKLAYDEQMKLLAKHGQVKLAQDLRAREERIRAQYAAYARNLAPEITRDAGRVKDGWVEELIGKRLNWSPDEKRRPLDVYESVFLDTSREEAMTDSRRNPPPVAEQTVSDSLPVTADLSETVSYEKYLSYLRPMVNRTSGEWAGLIGARSADGAWEWSEQEGNRLLLKTRETDAAEHAAPLHLRSSVPFLTLPVPGKTFWGTIWWAIIAIFAVLFVLLRFVVLRVFLLKLDDPVTMLHAHDFTCQGATKKHFVVLGAPFLDVGWLLNGSPVKRITLKDAVSKQNAEAEQNGELLAIDDFDYRSDDPGWNMKRLSLLEKLHKERSVIIFSRRDPFCFCLAPACGSHQQKPSAASTANQMDRWMKVVSSFWVIHIEDKGERQSFMDSLCEEKQKLIPPDAQADRRFAQYLRWLSRRLPNGDRHRAALYDSLADECAPRAYLQNVGREILAHPKFKELSAEQLIRLLLEQAEAYYKAVWATCSPDQKLTLYYLAQDCLVSAKNIEVRRLMRRGLIVRDPDVRLMNKSFRQFVLSTATPEEIRADARMDSSWSKLRLPLLLVLLGVALFLLVSHPELYSSSMAIITALATGIPTVFRLLGMFQRGKPASELTQMSAGATPHAT